MHCIIFCIIFAELKLNTEDMEFTPKIKYGEKVTLALDNQVLGICTGYKIRSNGERAIGDDDLSYEIAWNNFTISEHKSIELSVIKEKKKITGFNNNTTDVA